MKPSPSIYLHQVADLLAQREDGIGGPATNCPTSEEVHHAAALLGDLLQKEETDGFTAKQINDVIQELAKISDRWIDPQTDPLGNDAREFLEDTIYRLGQVLDKYVPNQADLRRKWADLRALQHCVNRTLYRKQQHPNFLTRLRRKFFKSAM